MIQFTILVQKIYTKLSSSAPRSIHSMQYPNTPTVLCSGDNISVKFKYEIMYYFCKIFKEQK